MAPVAKVVHYNFGIVEELVTSNNALAINQLKVDGPSRGGIDWRVGRNAGSRIEIIPDIEKGKKFRNFGWKGCNEWNFRARKK